METETMIRELRNLQEKHKNDNVFPSETCWADVCKDAADRLEKLQTENTELRGRVEDCGDSRLSGILDGMTGKGKLTIGRDEYNVYMGQMIVTLTAMPGGSRILHKFSLIEI